MPICRQYPRQEGAEERRRSGTQVIHLSIHGGTVAQAHFEASQVNAIGFRQSVIRFIAEQHVAVIFDEHGGRDMIRPLPQTHGFGFARSGFDSRNQCFSSAEINADCMHKPEKKMTCGTILT